MTAPEQEGRQRAEEFRAEHDLGTQPIPDLVELIERTTGCDVVVLDADEDEHGLTVHDPASGRTLIGVAKTPHPMRLRSTLAHELGHVLFQDWLAADEDLGERRPAEVRADAFTRHLLLPMDALRANSKGVPIDEALVSTLAQAYGVSASLVAVALGRAQLVDPVRAGQWRATSTATLATRFGWRDQYNQLAEQSNRYRPPQRLLARATRGYEDDVVSAQVLASLRRLPLPQVQQELAEAGIRPLESELTWEMAPAAGMTEADLSELDALLGGDDPQR